LAFPFRHKVQGMVLRLWTHHEPLVQGSRSYTHKTPGNSNHVGNTVH